MIIQTPDRTTFTGAEETRIQEKKDMRAIEGTLQEGIAKTRNEAKNVKKFSVSEFSTAQEGDVYKVSFRFTVTTGKETTNPSKVYHGEGSDTKQAIINAVAEKHNRNRCSTMSPFLISTAFGSFIPEISAIIQNGDEVRIVINHTTRSSRTFDYIDCSFTGISANPDSNIAFCEAFTQASANLKDQVMAARES
jgi:hypothetical protein